MREKHHRQRRIAIRQRRFEIRPVSIDAGCLGGRVVNARDNQLVPIAFDDDVPIVQRIPADGVDVVEPALRLAEVFVVTGDVHAGEPRPHPGERPGLCFT